MIFSKDNKNLTDVEPVIAEADTFFESNSEDVILDNSNETLESLVTNTGPLRPSIISEGFEFIGELKAPQGNVTIDGVFKGTLVVKSLIVGNAGLVEGNIQADSLTLKGAMKGTIDAGDLQVTAKASLDGQTVYRDLTISRGAQVLGELKRRQ